MLQEKRYRFKCEKYKTEQEKRQLSKLYRTIRKKIKQNTVQYKSDITKQYLEKTEGIKRIKKNSTGPPTKHLRRNNYQQKRFIRNSYPIL